MNFREGVLSLRTFIKRLVSDRVNSRDKYRDWKKKPENEAFMAECFKYERKGEMPSINALVELDFHPTLPLILLNYSDTAHATLHRFPSGWTTALRLCRGIVFSRRGALVAIAYPKFFNYGEMPETKNLPDEPFDVSEKYDGHLGIIFWFSGRLVATSRGRFESPTSVLANQMLAEYVQKFGWDKRFPRQFTLLVEIIHPDTAVKVDYGDRKEFIATGAIDIRRFNDCDYQETALLAGRLGLRVAERWSGSSVADLLKLMSDLSVKNREGGVIRFRVSGLRVKVKFADYINQMVEEKLGFPSRSGKPVKQYGKKPSPYRYLMMRMMTGTLERMTGNLEGEVHIRTQEMVRELRRAHQMGKNRKEQLAYLRGLVPAEDCTAYYKAMAGKFLTHLTTGQTAEGLEEESE